MKIAEAVSRAVPLLDDVSDGFEALVGVSESIQEIKGLILKIAPSNSSVLITGESGTGKEIAARLVHQHSRRAQAPFVCVNCAALPDSLVESELFGHERGAFTGAVTRQIGQMKNADRGTLFLDEIGDMSGVAQSKLLRALEQHEIQPLGSARPIPVDVRLITATHRELERLVAEEKFRSDLYYRLDVSRIHLPPLRDRAMDIPVLAMHFVRIMNRVYGRQLLGLTPAALQTLARHDWPGNVRQLRNVIEAAAAICESDWISDCDIRAMHSFSISGPPRVRTIAAAVISTKQLKLGKDALLEALEATHWNMTRTAELLRWSRSTLYRNVARHHIERDGERVTHVGSAPVDAQ
jgi:DNA-binding NtrC family response regulator